MAESDTSQHDLKVLSASAHTPESFGRAIVSASLAAAADIGASGVRHARCLFWNELVDRLKLLHGDCVQPSLAGLQAACHDH
jgi:hypothetical protein